MSRDQDFAEAFVKRLITPETVVAKKRENEKDAAREKIDKTQFYENQVKQRQSIADSN